jgi:hypothetical protein
MSDRRRAPPAQDTQRMLDTINCTLAQLTTATNRMSDNQHAMVDAQRAMAATMEKLSDGTLELSRAMLDKLPQADTSEAEIQDRIKEVVNEAVNEAIEDAIDDIVERVIDHLRRDPRTCDLTRMDLELMFDPVRRRARQDWLQ